MFCNMVKQEAACSCFYYSRYVGCYIVTDFLCCQVNILLCILGSKDICEQNQDELEALIQSSDEEEMNENVDKQKGNGKKKKQQGRGPKRFDKSVLKILVTLLANVNKGQKHYI